MMITCARRRDWVGLGAMLPLLLLVGRLDEERAEAGVRLEAYRSSSACSAGLLLLLCAEVLQWHRADLLGRLQTMRVLVRLIL